MQCHMLDAVVFQQQPLRTHQDHRPFGGIRERQVSRQRNALGAHVPNMQIVHTGNAGDTRQRAPDGIVVQMGGNAFHQHPGRLCEETPCRTQDQ